MHLAFNLALLFILKLKLKIKKPLSTMLTDKYNYQTLLLFRKFERLYKKLIKAKLDLDFLTKCKAFETFPKFLRFKLYKQSLTQTNLYKSWQAKLLDLEIRDTEHLVCNLQSHALTISGSLQSILSTIDYIYLLHINKTNITRFKNTISSSHKHKLNSLGL